MNILRHLRAIPTSARLGLAFCLIAVACSQTFGPDPVVTVTVLPVLGPASLAPSGLVFPVTTRIYGSVGGALAGVSVAYSTNPTTITASPASATTDDCGDATSSVLVPYGTAGTLVATGAGIVESVPVSAPLLSLSALGATPTMVMSSNGVAFQVSAQATVSLPDGGALPSCSLYANGGTGGGGTGGSGTGGSGTGDAGSDASGGVGVEGVTLTFTATPLDGTGMPVSGMATTNLHGAATASLVLPFANNYALQVSATGALSPTPFLLPNANPLSPSAPATLDPTQTTVSIVNGVDAGFGGAVYSVVTTAVAGGKASGGVAVSFAVIFPYPGLAAPVAMPASMMTDANGHATTTVAVAANTGPVVVELSAGSSVIDCNVPALSSAGACTLASPDAGP